MSDTDRIDHDRLFKELLTTFFVEFIELFLPDVSHYVHKESLRFLDKEMFTDVTSGRKHIVDILVLAQMRDGEAAFLIHVENQSEPEEDFPKRMFRYFARLDEKFNMPVYPVALFSFATPLREEPATYKVEFPGFVVNAFQFRSIQLNRLNWRDFIRKPNPVASALMAKMQIAPVDRPKVKMECLRMMATLKLNPAKMQLIGGFVDTYLQLNAEEERRFQAEVEAIRPKKVRETVMQIMPDAMRRGIEIGREEGREVGRHEGQEQIVLRQLRRKFGEVSEEREARIHRLTVAQLEDLSEALLDFNSLTDADAWIADQTPKS